MYLYFIKAIRKYHTWIIFEVSLLFAMIKTAACLYVKNISEKGNKILNHNEQSTLYVAQFLDHN